MLLIDQSLTVERDLLAFDSEVAQAGKDNGNVNIGLSLQAGYDRVISMAAPVATMLGYRIGNVVGYEPRFPETKALSQLVLLLALRDFWARVINVAKEDRSRARMEDYSGEAKRQLQICRSVGIRMTEAKPAPTVSFDVVPGGTQTARTLTVAICGKASGPTSPKTILVAANQRLQITCNEPFTAFAVPNAEYNTKGPLGHLGLFEQSVTGGLLDEPLQRTRRLSDYLSAELPDTLLFPWVIPVVR
jgi:hypothetical protein